MAGGVNYTLASATATGDKVARAEQNGDLRVMYDTYASGGAADTVVYLGDKLPKGAVVIAIYLVCNYADASLTLDIGDAADIDRYVDGLDASSAINGLQTVLTGGVGYTIGTATGDDQIQIKLLGATASGDIQIAVVYSV